MTQTRLKEFPDAPTPDPTIDFKSYILLYSNLQNKHYSTIIGSINWKCDRVSVKFWKNWVKEKERKGKRAPVGFPSSEVGLHHPFFLSAACHDDLKIMCLRQMLPHHDGLHFAAPCPCRRKIEAPGEEMKEVWDVGKEERGRGVKMWFFSKLVSVAFPGSDTCWDSCLPPRCGVLITVNTRLVAGGLRLGISGE